LAWRAQRDIGTEARLAGGAGGWGTAACGLDHNVSRAADHAAMLDIVAPDQNQPATTVHIGQIGHGKARLTAARAGRAQLAPAIPPPQECTHADQRQHHHKGNEERQGLPADKCVHRSHSVSVPPPYGPTDIGRCRPTVPVDEAAAASDRYRRSPNSGHEIPENARRSGQAI